MPCLHVICQGNLKENYLKDACAEYLKRLSPYCKVDIFECKSDLPDALYDRLSQTKGRKIALCVEGKQTSSSGFAEMISSVFSSGESDIVFVIGGSDGLSERVKGLCSFRLSFSEMTFPHQLMRVILLEQIYRAFTIINGKTYHK